MDMRDRLLIMVIMKLLGKSSEPGNIELVYLDCQKEVERWQDFEMRRGRQTD